MIIYGWSKKCHYRFQTAKQRDTPSMIISLYNSRLYTQCSTFRFFEARKFSLWTSEFYRIFQIPSTSPFDIFLRFARVTDPPVGFFLGGSSIRPWLRCRRSECSSFWILSHPKKNKSEIILWKDMKRWYYIQPIYSSPLDVFQLWNSWMF